jgi:hypothetical protein
LQNRTVFGNWELNGYTAQAADFLLHYGKDWLNRND